MRNARVLSLLATALAVNVVACAGVKPGATNPDGGGGSSGGGSTGFDGGRPDIPTIEVGNPSLCGNGMQDQGEQCDDGNKTAGDGCSAICQIPAGWSCSGWPSVCTMAGVCGDGILGASEACDDHNTMDGDGCSADCKKVDPGYECRVPGRKCVPSCGDGMKIGTEQCDDGNTMNGDGCSATCQIEPGASCMGSPSVCKASICGNGMKEGNEGCDCGTSLTGPWPTGCKGPNGLFFGDATGCSKTCTQEPSCRTGTTTGACSISCGNGAIEMGEACDDGNLDDGDGCSKTCTLEGGFMCSAVMQDDAAPCTDAANGGASAKCLQLPIILRDFKNEKETGGHPDFFYLGASVANPVSITGVQGQAGATTFSKRYCVPNSSGPAKKNDSANRCWDLAQANLGAGGKPVFNMARTGAGGNPLLCDCQFIDWSHDGNGGHVPGITMTQSPTNGLTYTDGASGHPMYRGPAPVVTSAASFGQWWVDSMYTGNTHQVGILEMKAIGGGQYQFSSQVNSVTGGFFPLDPAAHGFPLYTVAPAGPGTPPQMVGTEPMLCNLWPYWFTSTGFGAMNNCRGDQYLFPPSLIPPDTTGTCPGGMNCNGKWYVGQQGWYHDSWFTDEARYLFTHTGPFTLQFYGDDDMFIFINGKLVIDLGGVHQRLPGRVDVNEAGMATITEGGSLDITGTNILPCATTSLDPYTGLPFNTLTNVDGNGHSNCTNATCDCRTRSVNLGLEMGKTYEIAVFGADRHPTESNYQLTLSGFATQKSNCMPRCGDGKQTGAEECDCGDSANMSSDPSCGGKSNDGSYGGCTMDCKYGPYCGDGMTDTANGEECDAGSRGNNVTYGNMDGCAPGCKRPHFCGDGNVDEAEGEQCDLGMGNGGNAPCTKECKVCVDCAI